MREVLVDRVFHTFCCCLMLPYSTPPFPFNPTSALLSRSLPSASHQNLWRPSSEHHQQACASCIPIPGSLCLSSPYVAAEDEPPAAPLASAFSEQTQSNAQPPLLDDPSSVLSGPPTMAGEPLPYAIAAVLAVSTGIVAGTVVLSVCASVTSPVWVPRPGFRAAKAAWRRTCCRS